MSKDLTDYRHQIDELDKQIIELLDNRIEISKLVGEYKKQNSINVLNSDREKEILDAIECSSKNYDIIKEIYFKILEQSKKVQR